MKKNIYKLGEYKIIESDTGDLRWEAHFGLCAFQEGRCFKKGAILFIGPAESQGDGFFKSEFIDHLKPLQAWLMTKYYCRGLEVYHCKTGKRVAKEEMLLWMLDRNINEGNWIYSEKPVQFPNNISTRIETGNIAFRLQQYEIIKKTTGQFVWKINTGPNTVSSGNCIILEDILFIVPGQNEQTNLIKQQFLANLKQLSEWNQTKYYCHRLSLHDCKTGNIIQKEGERLPGDRREMEKFDIGNGYKNTAEFKIPDGKQRGIFSVRIFPILDSLANLSTSSGDHARFFRFKFIKSYISKIIAIFRTSGIWKRITYTVALIFVIISLLFAFLIGFRKEHDEKRHYKKGEHTSSHHRD
ncbi:MAG: hypothetical protein KKD47_06765 [Proteobacteria bacterium]|nr:hypothetical protein [Pseudomonadota bacterium]